MKFKPFHCVISTFWILIIINYSISRKLYVEDVDVGFINDTYINRGTFDVSINYKPNSENSLNLKVDLLKDFPEDTIVKCSASTRVFGREIPTRLSYTSKLCEKPARTYYDLVLQPLGMSECPPVAGNYENNDLSINVSGLSFPDIMPNAYLMFDFVIKTENIKIAEYRAFISI